MQYLNIPKYIYLNTIVRFSVERKNNELQLANKTKTSVFGKLPKTFKKTQKYFKKTTFFLFRLILKLNCNTRADRIRINFKTRAHTSSLFKSSLK